MESSESPQKTLSKEVATLKAIVKNLDSLEKFLKTDPKNNLSEIQKAIKKIDELVKIAKVDPLLKVPIDVKIAQVKTSLQKWNDELRSSFSKDLLNEARAAGYELRNVMPNLQSKYFDLDVNLDKGQVAVYYGPRQQKIGVCKTDAKEVVKLLQETERGLTQRPFSNQSFIKTLLDSYRLSLVRANKRPGDQVSIEEILALFTFLSQDRRFFSEPTKDNFKTIGKVNFSFDLYRLKDRKVDGNELSFVVATRASSDFLWIPTDDRGNGIYVSHIKFKEGAL